MYNSKEIKKPLSSIIKENTKIGINLERPKSGVFVIGVFKNNIFLYFSPRAPGPFGAKKGGLKIAQKFF